MWIRLAALVVGHLFELHLAQRSVRRERPSTRLVAGPLLELLAHLCGCLALGERLLCLSAYVCISAFAFLRSVILAVFVLRCHRQDLVRVTASIHGTHRCARLLLVLARGAYEIDAFPRRQAGVLGARSLVQNAFEDA